MCEIVIGINVLQLLLIWSLSLVHDICYSGEEINYIIRYLSFGIVARKVNLGDNDHFNMVMVKHI